MAKMLLAEKIPDWLKNLPADAQLSRKEVARALGYHSLSAVSKAARKGWLPQHDSEFFLDGQCRKFWYARTIRNEIRRRKQVAEKQPGLNEAD